MRIAPILLTLSLLAAPAATLAKIPAPHVSDADIIRPLPLPYDTAADGDAQVKAAMAKARKAHKLLLIDLGGNWCLDCRVLAGVMDIPTLHSFIEKHYELVSIDVGRFDKNQQIPGHYGITKLEGVPALLVVDPRGDKLRNPGRVSALADARSMSAQALADWLAQWL